jgi:hypothetical protein
MFSSDPQKSTQIKKIMSELKLKGRVEMLNGGGGGPTGSKKIRCYLLIHVLPQQGLKLPIPDLDQSLIYQGPDGQWHTWPDKAPLSRYQLEFDYQESNDSLSIWVDSFDGSRSASPISDFKKELEGLK